MRKPPRPRGAVLGGLMAMPLAVALLGAAPAARAAGGIIDCRARPATAPARLDQAGYLALVRRLRAGSVEKLGSEERRLLQSLDASPGADAGNTLAGLFSVVGAWRAGVVAVAWSAERAPQDPVYASNLGVLADELGETAAAEQLFRYAATLSRDGGFATLNLAWHLLNRCEPTAAAGLFASVARAHPGDPSASLGQDLIALDRAAAAGAPGVEASAARVLERLSAGRRPVPAPRPPAGGAAAVLPPAPWTSNPVTFPYLKAIETYAKWLLKNQMDAMAANSATEPAKSQEVKIG